MPTVVIVDYGMGNLGSVSNRVRQLGYQPAISSSAAEVLAADKLILPGVGHFGRAMENLRRLDLLDPLRERVLHDRTSILGICLGMQLLTEYSEEGQAEGLGWIAGKTVRLEIPASLPHLKVPHMGWNSTKPAKKSRLFQGLPRDSLFYFVHSYHVVCHHPIDVLSSTTYGREFTASVERNHIMGTQFHPEKSHAAGSRLLENFLRLP